MVIPTRKGKFKNLDTYKARFTNLRIHVFGIEQVLGGEFVLEIYQARVSPELWLCRPSSRHTAQWKARSAEDLMRTIESYFETCLQSWERVTHTASPPKPRQERQSPAQPESETVQ
jgi:hypothetical protein